MADQEENERVLQLTMDNTRQLKVGYTLLIYLMFVTICLCVVSIFITCTMISNYVHVRA